MNLASFAFWSCALLNVVLAIGAAVFFRRRVTKRQTSERSAKAAYSGSCIGIAVLSGTIVYLGAIQLFEIPLGHSEALVAPIFNIVIAVALVVIGRIIIGWVPVKW